MPEAVSRTLTPADLISELQPGNVFYVDPSAGDDDNDGLSTDKPKATLQAAIDLCEDDNGDIIYVEPGSHSVTTAVLFNKKGITVQAARSGYNPEPSGEKHMINAASSYTDGPAAIITEPCTIRGLGFAGRELTGESLLFDCDETGGFNAGFSLIENCRFPTWYGAIDCGIRFKGGQSNTIRACTFDGLFTGFDVAAIILERDGSIDPGFLRVEGCRFSGVGSGKHAINHASGGTPLAVNYVSNYIDAGFSGDIGKFLENNSVVSTGLIADNWLGGQANKGAAFENLGSATLKFTGNHYEE